MSTHEIERVFLLDRLPDLPDGAEAVRVEQGYLPEHDSAESSSSRTVAIVLMRSMLAIRAWSPVAGPLPSFQSKSRWIGPANKSAPA